MIVGYLCKKVISGFNASLTFVINTTTTWKGVSFIQLNTTSLLTIEE